jgi:prophage regulatory protein
MQGAPAVARLLQEYIMHQLMKINALVASTKMSRSQIYALIQKGEFPKPIKLSERSSAWVESEIQEWIDIRIVLRNEEAA